MSIKAHVKGDLKLSTAPSENDFFLFSVKLYLFPEVVVPCSAGLMHLVIYYFESCNEHWLSLRYRFPLQACSFWSLPKTYSKQIKRFRKMQCVFEFSASESALTLGLLSQHSLCHILSLNSHKICDFFQILKSSTIVCLLLPV